MESTSQSTVSKFFANKNIFITGSLGYVGRVLLEKILRACPGVGKIYILVRSDKKGNSGEERVRKMLNAPLFQRIRDINGNLLDKIMPVNGDVTLKELGINAEMSATLKKNVSIVIHSAASTNFVHGMSNLLRINVGGTKNTLEWAAKLENLKVFLYVSTAFSNSDRAEVEEMVYPCRVSPQTALTMCYELPADILNSMGPTLRGNQKLDYTFSKHLAEILVQEYQSNLPVCIVRPAIVGPACSEPFPGWMDNFTGLFGAGAALGKGIGHVMFLNEKDSMDVVPVDFVVNTILAAAMSRALDLQKSEDTLVFNCSSSDHPFLKPKDAILAAFRETPLFNEIYWYPCGIPVHSRRAFYILDFLLHYIPAVVIDALLKVIGKKPKFGVVDTYKKLKKLADVAVDVSELVFTAKTKNVKDLYSLLETKDREEFYLDLTQVDHKKYIQNCALGLRRYAVGAHDKDLPKARANMKRYYRYHLASMAFLFLMVAFFVFRIL